MTGRRHDPRPGGPPSHLERPSTVISACRQVSAALLGLALLAGPVAAQEPEAIGRVVAQVGPATAMRATEPRSLRLGAPLYTGDWIATGPAARLRIELKDGSHLSLGAESRIEIDSLTFTAGGDGLGGALELVYGILRTVLSGPKWRDGFALETRAAIASVRSTDFIVEAGADNTAVFVAEGWVEVAPLSAPALVLGSGFGVDVPLGANAVEAKAWGPARIAGVMARTRVP